MNVGLSHKNPVTLVLVQDGLILKVKAMSCCLKSKSSLDFTLPFNSIQPLFPHYLESDGLGDLASLIFIFISEIKNMHQQWT